MWEFIIRIIRSGHERICRLAVPCDDVRCFPRIQFLEMYNMTCSQIKCLCIQVLAKISIEYIIAFSKEKKKDKYCLFVMHVYNTLLFLKDNRICSCLCFLWNHNLHIWVEHLEVSGPNKTYRDKWRCILKVLNIVDMVKFSFSHHPKEAAIRLRAYMTLPPIKVPRNMMDKNSCRLPYVKPRLRDIRCYFACKSSKCFYSPHDNLLYNERFIKIVKKNVDSIKISNNRS